MHRKFKELDKLIEFKVELANQLGKYIKALRSDRDSECWD